jgi:hypothetical protein
MMISQTTMPALPLATSAVDGLDRRLHRMSIAGVRCRGNVGRFFRIVERECPSTTTAQYCTSLPTGQMQRSDMVHMQRG